MKPKSPKHILATMEYMLWLAQRLPPFLGRRKAAALVRVANRHQIRMKKIKQMICRKCHSFLTPKVSCVAEVVKRGCGTGIEVKCNNCHDTTFTVRRRNG